MMTPGRGASASPADTMQKSLTNGDAGRPENGPAHFTTVSTYTEFPPHSLPDGRR